MRSAAFLTSTFQVLALRAAAKRLSLNDVEIFTSGSPRVRAACDSFLPPNQRVTALRWRRLEHRRAVPRWAGAVLDYALQTRLRAYDVFLAGYYGSVPEFVSRLARAHRVIVLDDGTATLTVARDRSSGVTRYWTKGTEFMTAFRGLSFGPNDVVTELSDEDLKLPATLSMQGPPLFVGSSIASRGVVSHRSYLHALELAQARLGQCDYLAHHRDSDEVLRMIKPRVRQIIRGTPFEVLLARRELSPRAITGISSTAMLSSRLMGYSRSQVFSVTLPNHEIFSDHEVLSEIARFMSKITTPIEYT